MIVIAGSLFRVAMADVLSSMPRGKAGSPAEGPPYNTILATGQERQSAGRRDTHAEDPAQEDRRRASGAAVRARPERVAARRGHGTRRLQPDPGRPRLGQ